MEFSSIDEIFAHNDRVHAQLLQVLTGVSDQQAVSFVDGEKWTIAQLVEHIAAVDEGSSKVCYRLLTKARDAGRLSTGSINISDDFARRIVEIEDEKLNAPDRVQPTGDASIEDSLARMEENRRRFAEIKPLFEQFDADLEKFPHPVFGDISAIEWLIVKGGHEERHARQITRILDKLT